MIKYCGNCFKMSLAVWEYLWHLWIIKFIDQMNSGYIYSNVISQKQNEKMSSLGWLNRLNSIFEKNFFNYNLDNKSLAKDLGVSERDLFRKVKRLTGLSPQKYLRQFRLKQAMQNLKSGKYKTVKETAHAAGYINVSYFIIQFEKEFGIKPFQVLKNEGWR